MMVLKVVVVMAVVLCVPLGLLVGAALREGPFGGSQSDGPFDRFITCDWCDAPLYDELGPTMSQCLDSPSGHHEVAG